MTPRATSFARALGIRHPLVSAGMGLIARPPLVAAVCEAGGLGMLGVSPAPVPVAARWIREIRTATRRPFGANLIVDTMTTGPASTEEHVDLLAREHVPIVVFHWHHPPPGWIELLHAAGTKVWMTVATAIEAADAVAAGFDAVVVQGAEAGGHNRSGTSLATLLPAAVAAAHPLPVLAAGGIADGPTAAAALAHGASAVVVGTRFVASREAHAHEGYKARIVAASAGDVVATTIFGPEWPDQPMRVLRNQAVRDAEAGRQPGSQPIGRTSLFGQPYEMPPRSAVLPTPETTGDLEQMCLAAGESVALVDEVRPAGDIVRGIMDGVRAVLA